MAAGPLLEFDGVTFGYGPAAPVLERFDLTLDEGEFCAVLGPSGSGKTTMLYLAAGLRAASGGRVLLKGEQVKAPSKETGLMLQDYGLLPWFTAGRNIEVGLAISGAAREERAPLAREWLGRLGLEGARGKYPRQLSGGQRQRVALARQFALKRELLLLDEPLSAVDELARERLQRTLFELTREEGSTVLMVTHSVEEAALLGTSVLVLTEHAPIHGGELLRSPFGGRLPERNDPDFREFCAAIRERLSV